MLSARTGVSSVPTTQPERPRRTSRTQAALVATGLGALLSAFACAGPGSNSTAAPATELQTAVQKLAQAEGIKFSVLSGGPESSVVTGDRTSPPGAPFGSSSGTVSWVSGEWAPGLPLKLVRKERVVYTRGDKVVHQTQSGAWEALDMRTTSPVGMDLVPGQGGSGSATAEEVAQGEPSATSAMVELHALYGLGSIQSPAEVFADFPSKVGDVQKTTQGDATVYSGKLTPQGAQSLARKSSGSRAESGASQLEASGTYSITVEHGAATEAVFVVARTGRVGDRTIAAISTHTYKIQSVCDVALEVPPQVLELLQ